MHALKHTLLGNRCTIKHAFIIYRHIFIRIQVGYTVEHIDILKSYLNMNKFMAKKRVKIYFKPILNLMTNVYKKTGCNLKNVLSFLLNFVV